MLCFPRNTKNDNIIFFSLRKCGAPHKSAYKSAYLKNKFLFSQPKHILGLKRTVTFERVLK